MELSQYFLQHNSQDFFGIILVIILYFYIFTIALKKFTLLESSVYLVIWVSYAFLKFFDISGLYPSYLWVVLDVFRCGVFIYLIGKVKKW
jgi:hypothetical protein